MAFDWALRKGRLDVGDKALEWGSIGAAPGAGGAPVVIMLHEGLGCLALWRDFPTEIAEATGLPIFAFSRAGYGQSDPVTLPRPLDYMTREAMDVLPDIMNAIGATSYVLLGHSDGATIAAEYAGRTQDSRIRGLILMAPHFYTEPMNIAEVEKAKAVFESTDLKARMAKYHRDPEVAFRGWNDAWLDSGFLDWNVAQVIDGFTIPVLVIQGLQDQYGTERQVREIKVRSPAPVDVALLDDCRHAPQFDQPEKTLALIKNFTEKLARPETTSATST
ncbi:MAG: alpha/beta fold hydrolase [Geminicoccaceae bacterium]